MILLIFGDLDRSVYPSIGSRIAFCILFQRIVLLLQPVQRFTGRPVRIDIDGDHKPQRIGFQNVLGAIERFVDVRIQFGFRKHIAVGQNRRDENLVALAGRIVDTELGAEHRSDSLAGILPTLLRQPCRIDHRPRQQIDIADEPVRHLLAQCSQTLIAQMAAQLGDGLAVLALGLLAFRRIILVGFEKVLEMIRIRFLFFLVDLGQRMIEPLGGLHPLGRCLCENRPLLSGVTFPPALRSRS